MKKYLLALSLFFGLLVNANAQQYHPLLDSVSNIWHYTGNYLPVRLQSSTNCSYPQMFDQGDGQYTGGDTVINATTYKIMYAGGSWSQGCLYGFIREDTAAQKVYFRDNTGAPEILLYDFSMQVGDSIYIDFIASQGNFYYTGNYRLDSIGTTTIQAGQRRAFYLNCHTCSNMYPLVWIEGVGTKIDVVYPYFENWQSYGWFTPCQEYQHNSMQFLICFEQSNTKTYYDSCALQIAMSNGCIMFTDSCHYGNICSSIQERNVISSLSVQPNPSVSTITLSMDLSSPADVSIYVWDIYGRRSVLNENVKLDTGRNEKQIDLSMLGSGIYMLECRSSSGSLFEKIIIQK